MQAPRQLRQHRLLRHLALLPPPRVRCQGRRCGLPLPPRTKRWQGLKMVVERKGGWDGRLGKLYNMHEQIKQGLGDAGSHQPEQGAQIQPEQGAQN